MSEPKWPSVVIGEFIRVGNVVYVATQSGEVFWVKKAQILGGGWQPWVRGERNRELHEVSWLTNALSELETIPVLIPPEEPDGTSS